MSNPLLSVWQSVRLRAGLRWQGRFPAFPVRHLFTIVACAVVYSVVAHIDNLEARTVEMEQHWTGVMADCLNGVYRATAADGTQIACLPAETFSPKRGS